MKPREEKITNIEEDVVFKGKFSFDDTLQVRGKLQGQINGEAGKVIIEKEGSIDGEILASELENYGLLKGKGRMSDYTLYQGGESDADLEVNSIMVEKGAVFNGTCKMGK